MNLGNRHSQHSFAQIPKVNMARSSFDRSYAVKDTFNFDELVPLFVEEILPGDTINLNVKSFIRLAPQVVPLMDNMYIDYFFFFVPNRLVWDNWEKFNGAQDDPSDNTDYIVPVLQNTTVANWNSVLSHFGIPYSNPAITLTNINALPFRAYTLIYNDWFRDENLVPKKPVPKGNGPDAATPYYSPLIRAKKHDYFTSALPWPQKGQAISLPMSGMAPVTGIGKASNNFPNSAVVVKDSSGNIVNYPSAAMVNHTIADGQFYIKGSNVTTFPEIFADLSDATSATINAFRQAMMMQSLLELDARGGTRYTEILKAHFNVISPDFRLQRPEFLSGGTTRINQHPVAQTSETATTPQANLAAYSTASNTGDKIGFSKSFVEHGYVIGLVNARADITYQQGINRLWHRKTRWDFFWPKLQELGEQAIYNKEIFVQPAASNTNDMIFGYQERYAEYRYHPSEIRGQFSSQFPTSLDVWHLAQEFATLPALNQTFIESNTPIERVLVVPNPTYPHLLADYWFDMKHARPMTTYGVPATLGRF